MPQSAPAARRSSRANHAPGERIIEANGLEFCVEERGSPDGMPLILIMGLGAQMTLWPEPLLEQYVAAGFRVIRFDNRDIGRSSEIRERVEGSLPLAMLRFRLGLPVAASYTLHHMAEDVVALMDALDLSSAHIAGASMGGMVGQILAAQFPQRVRSLMLIMTSTNHPRAPLPELRVIWRLQGGGIKGHDEKAAVARALAFWRTVQSPRYQVADAEVRERLVRDYRRSYRPWGILRQMRAIMATGSLEPLSRQIRVPTCIVHGEADPLIRPPAARRLQQLIPGSKLHWMPGMGHDLPLPLLGEIVALNRQMAAAVESGSRAA